MNRLEIAVRKAIAKLITAYGQKIDDTEDFVFVYLDALRDLDPIDVEGGAARVIRSERYFPRPAVLRAFALEERTARTVTLRPQTYATADVLCSQCGATRLWDREVTNARGTFLRYEVVHEFGCPLKRPDQPGGSLRVA